MLSMLAKPEERAGLYRLAVPTFLYAFDPGRDTGYACFVQGNLANTMVIPGDREHAQYATIADLIVDNHAEGLVVVCEGYTSPRMLDRHGSHTLGLIGWIRGHALCNERPFYLQMPPVKRPYRAQAHGMAKTDHERDAVAHGLAWLAAHTC